MQPGLADTRREGFFCNIDELSAGGITHLEPGTRKSIKPKVRVMTLFFLTLSQQIGAWR